MKDEIRLLETYATLDENMELRIYERDFGDNENLYIPILFDTDEISFDLEGTTISGDPMNAKGLEYLRISNSWYSLERAKEIADDIMGECLMKNILIEGER